MQFFGLMRVNSAVCEYRKIAGILFFLLQSSQEENDVVSTEVTAHSSHLPCSI